MDQNCLISNLPSSRDSFESRRTRTLTDWSEQVAYQSAIALTCFGLTVMMAWALHWQAFIGLGSASAGMTCDSAVCSVLAGLGILSIRRTSGVMAGVFAWASFALGAVYLYGNLSGEWFSIHRYLPQLTSAIVSPQAGRTIHVTTAGSLLTVVLGGTLLILKGDRMSKRQIRWAGVCITALVTTGALGVLAAVTGLSSDPIWMRSSFGVTLGTGVYGVVAAVALLALLVSKASRRHHNLEIPFVLTGVGSLSLLLIWAVTQSTSVAYAQVAAQTRSGMLSTSAQVAALYSVTRCVRNSEAAQRGFLLTGDRVYLDDYVAAVKAVGAALDSLSVFKERRRDCAKLEALTAGKLLELEETVRLETEGDHEEAVAIIRSDVGRRFMAGIEAERNRLTAQLKSDLAKRLEADSRSYQSVRETVLLGYGLGLLLTVLGMALVRKDFRMRKRLESVLRESSERLEQRVRARTAKLAEQRDLLQSEIAARTAVENSLRRREAQLSTIFDTGLVGDWTWIIETGQVTAHPSVWRMWGAPAGMASAPLAWFRAHRHPDDAEKLETAIEGALIDDQPFDLEYRILHPDGSIRWISVVGNVSRNASGVPVQAQGLNIDITARKAD